MSDPTRTPQQAVEEMLVQALADMPLPQGADVQYDETMREIEPDLVTDALPTLAAKYANETPEQHAERAKRYNRAFALYEERMRKQGAELSARISEHQRAAFASLEKETIASEAKQIANIEQSINNTAA